MPDSQNASWASLFAAANAFRELGPWEWMNDNQVFGVKDPATGEVAWCAVLGMRGEVFGLAAYLGTEGLDIHRGIQSGKLGPDSDEICFGFPCLLTSFENRQELEASDLSLIRSLGLTFRGRNAWPQFRSHRRGWYPWHLEGSEVAFLTDVIQQAVVVCARLRSEKGLLGRANAPERFVRVIDKGGIWGDSWMRPAPPVAARYPASFGDEQETVGLKGTRSSRVGTWEVDLFYVPTPTRENSDERPYYPVAMVWADQRSGMVLGTSAQPPAMSGQRAWQPATLVHTLVQRIGCPATACDIALFPQQPTRLPGPFSAV